jgi:hypothetical protein
MLFPALLDLELSNRCNRACIMCVRPEADRQGAMTEALLDCVLDEALGYPRRWFRLHGLGEPLLSPLLPRAVARIKNPAQEHKIELVTNGDLLEGRMAKWLLGQGVDIVNISLGAATAATYQDVRKSVSGHLAPGAFERVVRNTLRLLDERERLSAKTAVVLQLVRTGPATDEEEAFIAFWSKLPVRIEIWHDFNAGREVLGESAQTVPTPCRHLTQAMIVLWDGRVGLCCIDALRRYPMGDLRAHSLGEIYNGDAFSRMRDLHASGSLASMPLCQRCLFRDDRHIARVVPAPTSRRPDDMRPRVKL